MYLADRLTLDAPHRTKDGYLAVRAKAARSGIYDYSGAEVDPQNKHGLRDKAAVKIYRPGDQVFDRASIHSFIGKPITDNHPTEAVTAANWRDHARGTIMGAIRDGEHIAFDLLLTDAAAIAAVENGKRELSNGYECQLKFDAGTTADGQAYDAIQESIAGNHIALVDRGRAGPDCRISDAARCDSLPASLFSPLNDQEKPVKTMLIDGLTVDIANADTAHATITTILAARDTATAKVAGLETQVATLTTDKATLAAEKTTLEQQVKDAKPTAAQLRDAAKVYSGICDKAKALGVQVADDADGDAIMKAVVDAKVGDLAKDWSPDQIAASFAVLTKDTRTTNDNRVVSIGSPSTIIHDNASVRDFARAAQY